MQRLVSPIARTSVARPGFGLVALLASAIWLALPASVSAQAGLPTFAAPDPLSGYAVPELRIGVDGLDDLQDLDQGGWETVEVEGATCGLGAPFKFYLNASGEADAGIFFLLSGGGACLKEGPAPEGVGGIAQQLYCMDFGNFEDPFFNDMVFGGFLGGLIGQAIPYFNRGNAENPFRDWHFVAVPYCTGDIFAGRAEEPFDYDPSPDGVFEVTHRGHLNLMAVADELQSRYPEDRPVLLSGLSAGGFGAILNYPEFVERWPQTVLLPDSGIGPLIRGSLMEREAVNVAERWQANALLPNYCNTPDCLQSTYRLLAAHAAYHDGTAGNWRPFGYIQGQQDSVLRDYLETSACGYQIGLKNDRTLDAPANLRGYIPATDQHVFSIIVDPSNPLSGGQPYRNQAGLAFTDWFFDLATAEEESGLPPDAMDPWMPCNDIMLNLLFNGR